MNNDEENNNLTFDLLGVGGTGVMCVDLFGSRTLVQADKPVEEVITGCVVVTASSVISEVILEWRLRQLLGKEIDFIQEQNLVDLIR